MTEEKAFELIFEELVKAFVKHPDYPEDKIHCAAILAEEAGELLQASNDYEYTKSALYKSKHYKAMILEAAQTGAMAIRFLINMKLDE